MLWGAHSHDVKSVITMLKRVTILSISASLALFCTLAACCQDAAAQRQASKRPANVPDLLARMDRAAAKLQDYTVTGTTESDGKQEQFKLTYKRPGLVRIDSRDGQVAVQPNQEIKGRLGRGVFGKIAQKIKRDDKRLKDSEGIPFYESDFVSMLARIRARIRAGDAATMKAGGTFYYLEIRSGDTVRGYRVDSRSFYLLENSRKVKGGPVEITRYTDFRPNSGVKLDRFKF
jgi:outer membrane lipoprotein-sorting protein